MVKVGDKYERFGDNEDSRDSFKFGETYTIKEIDDDIVYFEEVSGRWTEPYFSKFLRLSEFQNGETVVDDSGREYYYVGKLKDGGHFVQDKYDETYDHRDWSESDRGDLHRPSAITELTLTQVAEKFGIDVKTLRIKD